MSIILDTSYKLTWGDWFSMGSASYNLKKRIINFRDHALEFKIKDDPYRTCLKIQQDIQHLIVKSNADEMLYCCPETSKVLIALRDRVQYLVQEARYTPYLYHPDSRESQAEPTSKNWGWRSSSPATADSFSSERTSSGTTLASGDGLWWPCVHVPVEIEVSVPDSFPGPAIGGDVGAYAWS